MEKKKKKKALLTSARIDKLNITSNYFGPSKQKNTSIVCEAAVSKTGYPGVISVFIYK